MFFPAGPRSSRRFPSPPLSPRWEAVLRLALGTAGEAEAAEPSTHNESSEGGGGETGCSEAGSLGAGMVGARVGQKGEQEKGECGLSSVLGMEGGMEMGRNAVACSRGDIREMCSFRAYDRGRKRDEVRGKGAKMDTAGKITVWCV